MEEGGPIHSLLIQNERQVLAVVTHDMVLTQFSVNPEGQTSQIMKVSSLFLTCSPRSLEQIKHVVV